MSSGEAYSMTETVIGILASGRGSNAQAIVDAVRAGRIRGKAAVLISDNPQASVLKRAKEWGIEVCCLDRKSYASHADFEAALAAELDRHGVRLLLLAGFMRLLSPAFIHLYKGRIMNIHPSLLPSFPGLHAQEQAVNYGARVSGCTVHFVDDGMDTGPIILQEAVPVYEDDSADNLAARILAVEHRLYPEAVRLFCEGRLQLNGRHVSILNSREAPK